ncbi:UDP-glucose 4-epimerase GalE [Sinanaerobacter sp. ZZT-01]|uniref:UDP-glucose 4-epimerase GalE n=1 Tax=Sinanaerobacter sp. ZZT-01 TaxID=3111540 RepID=UPI002D765FB4|nr:UDP-glucose 4-epimerase GalE [Sinanaerobacter sp. ZZT-01]WRR94885.1 UDP-glucose 4-epimerase GalE [Sinanaerobacter sp. ZZT-01]
MSILVTGATGYIGSHTCVCLLEKGYEVVMLDNLSNSKKSVCDRISRIAGKRSAFYSCDMCDKKALDWVFEQHKIDAVIHFAGLKAIGESVQEPLRYYQNNIVSTLNLLESMNKHSVKTLVFSSSATVYGEAPTLPIREDFPLSATNPYGATKLMVEQILKDVYCADQEWKIALLRYFNPVGAHASGLIGEDAEGIPNNLVPYVINVALGKTSKLKIFGKDYPTKDGTGVRDYIHVMDLAEAHLAALEALEKKGGLHTYNLGTGKGYSVLDVIDTFEKVNGKVIPYEFVARRWGDIATCYADSTKAQEELGWYAVRTLEDMCKDAWNFAVSNLGRNES